MSDSPAGHPPEMIMSLIQGRIDPDEVLRMQREKDPGRLEAVRQAEQARVSWLDPILVCLQEHLYVVARDSAAGQGWSGLSSAAAARSSATISRTGKRARWSTSASRPTARFPARPGRGSGLATAARVLLPGLRHSARRRAGPGGVPVHLQLPARPRRLTCGPRSGSPAARRNCKSRPGDCPRTTSVPATPGRWTGRGTPVILPAVAGSEPELAVAYAGVIDGLVLAGGTDIHPQSYGEPVQPAFTDSPDLSRDTLELALVAEARRAGMPVLGICRGMQLLNVAYGGSLHQHKPHAQGAGAVVNGLTVTLTEVSVQAGSRLRDVLGRQRARVYCIHHQAIGRLGSGLAATAHSADGLVEAVEDASAGFVLGVMWHPEQMTGQVGADAPYRALVSAAAARVHAALRRDGGGPGSGRRQ